MGIQVTQAQESLEKQHGCGPHCRTATKPWEDLFAEQGLNLKQQKSAGEYRQGERQETPGIGGLVWKGMGHDIALAGNQTSTFNFIKNSTPCHPYKQQIFSSRLSGADFTVVNLNNFPTV
jgi:hypothetical protein